MTSSNKCVTKGHQNAQTRDGGKKAMLVAKCLKNFAGDTQNINESKIRLVTGLSPCKISSPRS